MKLNFKTFYRSFGLTLGFTFSLAAAANSFTGENYYTTQQNLQHHDELNNHHFSQVTLIAGRPDFNLNFVNNTVVDGYRFVNAAEMNFTTQYVSILARKGVNRITMAEILDARSSTSSGLLYRAIQFGASRSPVVVFALGTPSSEQNNATCRFMKQYPNTVFVTVAPQRHSSHYPEVEPDCQARHIVRVTALNSFQDDLEHNAPFGDAVRLAAPSYRIPTVGQGGFRTTTSGISPATIIAAAELAKHAHENPRLSGASLVDSFLEFKAIYLPALEGKVELSKAIVDFPYSSQE